MSEAFSLGALVVPAIDCELAKLGYDVEELGLKALGIVIDPRKKKSQVSFPELNIAIWLDHTEMADVQSEAESGNEAYAELLPDIEQERPEEIVFWIHDLCQRLNVKFILGTESGELLEVWDQEDNPLDHYYNGRVDIPVTYLGLGVEEFRPEEWEKAQSLLGDKLLFSRILPSGMHKLEMALYLRRDL